MKRIESSYSGWGNYPVHTCHGVDLNFPIDSLDVLPSSSYYVPRGAGKSYGDAATGLSDSLILETEGQNMFLSLNENEKIISALPGVTLEEIMDVIIPKGLFLPVTPGTRLITLGGALGANVHGKNHHVSGAISNFVDSIEVLTENGLLSASPKENADLFNATIGGFGMTGLIQKINLKLKPIETGLISARAIKAVDFLEVMELLQKWDSDYEYSVTWIDVLSKGKNLGRGIVMLGNHTTLETFKAKSEKDPLQNKWMPKLDLIPPFAHYFLRPWSAKLFNWAYFHRLFKKEIFYDSNFEGWFYPLDALWKWNRLYGKSGFLQYQFVVPFENAEEALKKVLEFISSQNLGSFLSVIKRVREDQVMLPFALPGYTLAMDIPLRDLSALEKAKELDRIILDYGGRIYLAKDSRMDPVTFKQMYPSYPEWIETVLKYCPNKKFSSALARRLEL